jgi:hypothetical protein
VYNRRDTTLEVLIMSRRRRNETEEQRARRELISDFLTAANIQSMDDIQELFKEALAGFMEGSLESELDSELGYEPYDVKNKETDNSRNGHSKKTLRTSMGKVDIEVPRDRNGEFEPIESPLSHPHSCLFSFPRQFNYL